MMSLPKPRSYARTAGIACPHCDQRAIVRSSRAVTSTYRTLNVQCQNVDCGHTFGAEITITHTIVPSAMPNPAVHLRQVPPRRRETPLPANDDHRGIGPLAGPEVPAPPAANDDDGFPCAVATGG